MSAIYGKVIWSICTLILSIAFMLSAWAHLNNQFFFVEGIADYEFASSDLVIFLAIWLPVFHLAVGIGLWYSDFSRILSLFALIALGIYMTAQLVVVSQGRSIECSCFGPSSSTIGAMSISTTTFLFFVALVLFAISNNRNISQLEK